MQILCFDFLGQMSVSFSKANLQDLAKFARSRPIQEQIYTIALNFSPTSSFSHLNDHSGVFLQTTQPIQMIFHMYNTTTYTKECGYLLIQIASSIFNNNNMTSQNLNSFSDEKIFLEHSGVRIPLSNSCHIFIKKNAHFVPLILLYPE